MICGMTFKRKCDLGKHQKWFVIKMVKNCLICDMTFSKKHEQQFLMKIDKKNCMICDMTFKRKCNLGKHSKTVHEEKKNFHYMICDMTFKRK